MAATNFKVAVVVLISVILCAVVLPLIVEVGLTLLTALGYRKARVHAHSLRISRLALEVSDKAEYGVASLVFLLIGVPIYIHFSEFVPFFAATLSSPDRPAVTSDPLVDDTWAHIVLFHVVPSVWINSCMLFYFFKAAFTSAGKPAEAADSLEGRLCRTCRTPKGRTTHHCGTCNTCVVDMDHHCPFTANCVGRGNYPYFLSFVFWGWMATAYAFWLAAHPYSHCNEHEEGLGEGVEVAEHHPCFTWSAQKDRFLFLAIAAFVVLSAFFLLLLVLLVTGRTVRSLSDFRDRQRPFHASQGALYRAQSRLGPVSRWWVYLLPLPIHVGEFSGHRAVSLVPAGAQL